MKNEKTTKSTSSDAVKGVGETALVGTAGIAILSAAAIGVAGYFAWRNREQILGFAEKYIDIPDSWKSAVKGDSLGQESSASYRSSSLNNSMNDSLSSNRM